MAAGDNLTKGSRSLHWVLKIGNLKKSLEFFEGVLGLKVLRHEEFDEGCEATCNGPYGGAWSKTMIGYGPEQENFTLELTYNYGVDRYDFGNDLQYIALQGDVKTIGRKAEARECKIEEIGETILITGPDNYSHKITPPVGRYKIIPPVVAGRKEAFVAIALRVSKLSQAEDYWINLLGLERLETAPGLETSDPSVLVGFDASQVGLQLIEVQDEGKGKPVDHAKSSGRIAFACHSVPPIFEKVKAAGDTVQTPPKRLPTPGKADVVVTILVDRDGYEICFVEDKAFYELANPTYDKIDFGERAKRGGDGNPPPKQEGRAKPDVSSTENIKTIEDADAFEKELADAAEGSLIVAEFSASWCGKCKKLAPSLEELAKQYADKMTLLSIDVDEVDDLASKYDVSTVPHLFFFKGRKKVDDFVGSDPKEVESRLENLTASS